MSGRAVRELRPYADVLARATLPPGYRRVVDIGEGEAKVETPEFVQHRDHDRAVEQAAHEYLYPKRDHQSALQRKYELMTAFGHHRPLPGTDVGSTMGSYNDVYKSMIFTDLFTRMTNDNTSPITYINLFGNALRYDMTHSRTRGFGIDSAYRISRHLAAAATRDIKYRRDTPFTQLMKHCRVTNSVDELQHSNNDKLYGWNHEITYTHDDCSERSILNKWKQLPKLDAAFKYFPGYLPIVRGCLRSHDRVVVMEPHLPYYDAIKQFVGTDRRFNVIHANPFYRGQHMDDEQTDLLWQVLDPNQPDVTLESAANFVNHKGRPVHNTTNKPSPQMPQQSDINNIVNELIALHVNRTFDTPGHKLRAAEMQYFIDQLKSTDLSYLGAQDKLLSDWLLDRDEELHRIRVRLSECMQQLNGVTVSVDGDNETAEALDDSQQQDNVSASPDQPAAKTVPAQGANNDADDEDADDAVDADIDTDELEYLQDTFNQLNGRQNKLRVLIKTSIKTIIASEEAKLHDDAEVQAVINQQSIPRDQPTHNQYHDAVAALTKPLTALQFIHLDIGEHESYDSVLHKLEQVKNQLLPTLLTAMPTAQLLLTYPIYGRSYPDELLTSVVATGVQSVLHSYYFPRNRAHVFDTDVAGTGVCIVNPPLYYENFLKRAEHWMDVMVDGALFVDQQSGVADVDKEDGSNEKLRRKYYPDTDNVFYTDAVKSMADAYYRPSRPSIRYLTEKDTAYDDNNPERFNSHYHLPDFSPVGSATLRQHAAKQANSGKRTHRPLDVDDRTTEEFMQTLGEMPTWRFLKGALPHIAGRKRRTKQDMVAQRRKSERQDQRKRSGATKQQTV